MSGFAESHVEQAALSWLHGLGYAVAHGPDVGPDGTAPERTAHAEVVLMERLRAALARLNPTLAADAVETVVRSIIASETPSLLEENRRLHRLMVNGVDVEVTRSDGSLGTEKAWLIDFDDPEANDWLAINQFTVVEGSANRRPDVVVFVNGLPLGVIELKNPGDEKIGRAHV